MNKQITLMVLMLLALGSPEVLAHFYARHDMGLMDGILHFISQHGFFLLLLLAAFMFFILRRKAND